MKDNRKVIIKNQLLKKVRNNLRKILITSVYDQIEIYQNFINLYGDLFELTLEEQKEVYFLQSSKQKLEGTLNNSICVCALCTKDDRDMVYIKSHDIWYCTKCQDKEYIWYQEMGSEEVNPNRGFIKAYKQQKLANSQKKENERQQVR